MTPAAKTQLRTAFLCAELAGSNWLRSWVRGRQSMVAFWEDQPRTAAAELAVDGWQYVPEQGTARVQVAAAEARACARLRDQKAAEAALARADLAREEVHDFDEPSGLLAYSLARQDQWAALARLLLDGEPNHTHAENLASRAVELYEAEPPEKRPLGELCHAQLNLAAAQLGRDNLEGAAANIGSVLTITAQRPSQTVTRRLGQLANALERPRFQTTSLALDLRDQLRTAISR